MGREPQELTTFTLALQSPVGLEQVHFEQARVSLKPEWVRSFWL